MPLVFLAALLPRLWAAWTSQCIASDGPVYAEVAARYLAGDWKTALSHPYHPLYPLLMALAYAVLGGWEAAGQAVSVLAGALAAIPLWHLARRLFDERAAAAACLLYAFSPYPVRLSSDVLTTGLYLALTMASLAALHDALQSGRARSGFLAGIAAGLSYLVRLDGLILGAAVAGLATVWRPREWKAEPARRARLLAATLAGVLLAAGPYVLYLRVDSGTWTVSRKTPGWWVTRSLSIPDFVAATKPVDPIPGQGDPVPAPASANAPAPVESAWRGHLDKWLSALGRVARETGEGAPWAALPLLAVGLCAALWPSARRWDALAVLAVPLTFEAALLVFSASFQRESKRYTVPIVTWLLPWFGLGAAWLADRVAALGKTAAWRAAALPVVMALALLALAPKTFQPIGGGKSGIKQAGLWIREHAPARPPVVVTNSPRTAFYAEGTLVGLGLIHRIPREHLHASLREAGAHYLVVDRWFAVVCEGFFEWVGDEAKSRLREVYSSQTVVGNDEDVDRIRVFEVLPAE